jgi:hypothetical protein
MNINRLLKIMFPSVKVGLINVLWSLLYFWFLWFMTWLLASIALTTLEFIAWKMLGSVNEAMITMSNGM